MFLEPLCKVKMKAIIKYYAEESRQEDYEMETFMRTTS